MVTHTRNEIDTDVVVLGAGIIGLNVATLLRERTGARVLLCEREPGPNGHKDTHAHTHTHTAAHIAHASGRNSGVIHSGLYYEPGSLKAQMTRAGNVYMTAYCQRKGVPIRRCGKIVLAHTRTHTQTSADGRSGRDAAMRTLETLHARAIANGVPIEPLTAAGVAAKEPLAFTQGATQGEVIGLWSPSTSVACVRTLAHAHAQDAAAAGVSFMYGTPSARDSAFVIEHRQEGRGVRLTWPGVSVRARHLVNCTGVHADVVAQRLGHAAKYAMLPFKGLYMYCEDLPLRTLIYPVPDVSKPFLGTHFTLTLDGHVKIGPTAMPALWREQYGDTREGDGILTALMRGFSLAELREIVSLQTRLMLRRPDFRRLAWEEIPKYLRSNMVRGATDLLQPHAQPRFTHFARAGIRAQLINTTTLQLEMDYIVEGDETSTHVLNAVSPGWTCSRPFAEYVVDKVVASGAL